MRVTIVGIIATDLHEIHCQGVRHPLLGRFLDAGSYALVADLLPGPAGLTQIVESLSSRATAMSVPFRGIPASLERVHMSAVGICVVQECIRLESAGEIAEHWQRELASAGALSLLVADGAERELSLWVLCAYGLPCMGPMAPVAVGDVCAHGFNSRVVIHQMVAFCWSNLCPLWIQEWKPGLL